MADNLQDLGNSFARSLRAANKADRTITIYMQAVRFYSDWLTAQGIEPTLDQLTRRRITDWLADLNTRNTPSTVRIRYRSLHRFCGWLVAEDELDSNPMQGIGLPELPEHPVPVLTDAELQALLDVCKGKDFYHRRDEAMVRVLLDCGVRVSEMCRMKVPDDDDPDPTRINLDAEMAMVKGKGSKVRPVYFSTRTTAALDRYLRVRRSHRWAHLDALLLTQRGAMSPDGVRDRIKILGDAAGIADLHPHRFRHTFAHDYLMSGGQERDLKRLAGWSSDTMLERYGASAADARAKAAARRMRRGDRV